MEAFGDRKVWWSASLLNFYLMKQSLITDEVIFVPFDEGIQKITKQIELNSSILQVEGLIGSSRSLFLARLIQSTSRPIIVLTPDQNTGEKLIGDLKYFFYFYMKHQKTEQHLLLIIIHIL